MITIKNSELKPCPFCGFESVIEKEPEQTGYSSAKLRAACSRGCVHTKWLDGTTHTDQPFGYVNIELSVQRHLVYFWNSRKP